MFLTVAILIQLPHLQVKVLLHSAVSGTGTGTAAAAAAADGRLLEMQNLRLCPRPLTQNRLFNQIPRYLLCT